MTATKIKKYVIKQLIITLIHYNLFLNAQEMCNKAVGTHPIPLPECSKTQEMCIKAVHRCFFVFDSIPDQYRTREICDLVASLYPSLIVYCPDKYITQKMCDEAADDYLTALKLIPDWFVTNKIIKKLVTALYADDTYTLL